MRAFLIVDDCQSDQKILAYILNDIQPETKVYSFRSGTRLHDWISEHRSSLTDHDLTIFCDQHLKPEFGNDVLEEVRTRFPEIKFFSILMSGSQLRRMKSYDEGWAHEIIEKKGDLEHYWNIIRMCLSRSHTFFSRNKSQQILYGT